MTAPEPAGLYAVVRVWSAPAHHVAAPAEQVTYVKGPSGWGDGSTYWYVLGCEDGWSWEQVTRHAVRVEVVRGGVSQPDNAKSTPAQP